MRYPLLTPNDNSSTLGGATAFTEDEDAVNGHLAVDDQGHVVFVVDQPDHDPEKE
jgi:hypothetical protein